VRSLREARGEKVLGRKIGFTNRTIWEQYGVYAPIWGYVYDTTVRNLDDISGQASLAAFPEPRIEPEIVFGMSTAPEAGMDERELLSCIGWVAHGYEIVQSVFPRWEFAPSDTVAAFGLHGALFIGERHQIGDDADKWFAPLSNFSITLRCGNVAESGRASDVLDGPLSALKHLVRLLASDQHNPPVAAGEIITTGTLTKAMPVKRGAVGHRIERIRSTGSISVSTDSQYFLEAVRISPRRRRSAPIPAADRCPSAGIYHLGSRMSRKKSLPMS
jgi:2-oxo-3-hexenedioate decarboxylase